MSVKLSDEINRINTEIEDIEFQIKTGRIYQKYRDCYSELKKLSGKSRVRFEIEHKDELTKYRSAAKLLAEWYPDGKAVPVEELEQKKKALEQELSNIKEQYTTVRNDLDQLTKAMQTIDDFLENEQRSQEKKRRKSDLE